MKKFIVKLVNRLLHNRIHQLLRYFWVLVNSESIFYSFFSQENCFPWSRCLLPITESINLDTSDKLLLQEQLEFVRQFENRLMILHHLLTTTSACKIFHEIFFNNNTNSTIKRCINNFFLETVLLFFFLRLFSLPA